MTLFFRGLGLLVYTTLSPITRTVYTSTLTPSGLYIYGQSGAVRSTLLRATTLNRTYGTHKHLHISLFVRTIFGPFYCGPPFYKKTKLNGFQPNYSQNTLRIAQPLKQGAILRGAIVNRTYGKHKKLNILSVFTNNIWSYLLWSPAIASLWNWFKQGTDIGVELVQTGDDPHSLLRLERVQAYRTVLRLHHAVRRGFPGIERIRSGRQRRKNGTHCSSISRSEKHARLTSRMQHQSTQSCLRRAKV